MRKSINGIKIQILLYNFNYTVKKIIIAAVEKNKRNGKTLDLHINSILKVIQHQYITFVIRSEYLYMYKNSEERKKQMQFA